MSKPTTLYEPSQIRTANMLPDRSADVSFPEDSSMTQQSFKDECDINVIVRRNEATGLLTHVNRNDPIWGADLGDAMDYKSSLDYINEANARFMALPAHVRARFQNDPARLLDFINDDKNYDEAKALGLVNGSQNLPEPEPVPNPAPVRKALRKPAETPEE